MNKDTYIRTNFSRDNDLRYGIYETDTHSGT